MSSFFRSNVLRRGEGDSSVEQSPNPEEPQQHQSEMEGQNQEERPRGSFPFSRRFMPALFAGRSNIGRREEPVRNGDDDTNSSSSSSSSGSNNEPKTPRPEDQAPSARLHLSHITRPWTRGSSRNPPSPPSPTADGNESSSASQPPPPPPSSPGSSSRRSSVNTAQYPGLATPPAVAALRSGSSRRRFAGPDPAEMHLAALADSGRRRQQRHQRRQHENEHGHRRTHSGGSTGSSRRMRRFEGNENRPSSSGTSGNGDGNNDGSNDSKPRRFLFCFPWIPSWRLRTQILKCFVSGLFMVVMLSVYLALSMTHHIGTSTFTIMLILMILFATIVFCHGLVRICMLLMGHHRPESRDGNDRDAERGLPYSYHHREMADVLGPGGYAVPRRPIRVVLARDEEAAGILDAEAAKLQPPAYGVWRESVRIDPNRFFWQRNDQAGVAMGAVAGNGNGNGSSDSDSSSESGSRSRSRSVRSGSRSGAGSGSGTGTGTGTGADSRPGSAGSARPPSYASDDGVSYVVEARPRSIAPPLLLGGGGDATTSTAPTASSSYYGSSSRSSSTTAPSTVESGGRSGSAGTLWPSNSGGVLRGERGGI